MDVGGELTFSKNVLSEIARRSLDEVDGIRGTSGDLMSGLIGRLSRGSTHRGISVSSLADGTRVFDLYLVVAHGSNIYELGQKAMDRVAENVAAMTGLRSVVNVRVTGIE